MDVFLKFFFLILSVSALNGQIRWKQTMVEQALYETDGSLDVEFQYVNGADEIRMLNFKSDCGCTVIKSFTKIIKPHATGSIIVRFSPAGRRGLNKKTVKVYTDDLNNPEDELSLKINVIDPLRITPAFLYFEAGDVLDPMVVTVEVAKDSGYSLKKISNPGGKLLNDLETASKTSYKIQVSVSDAASFTRDFLQLRFENAEGQKETRLVHVLKK